MANSVDPDIGAVCSGSTLFPSIPYWSVMIGNYLQQTPPADDIFRYIFLGALRAKFISFYLYTIDNQCPKYEPLASKNVGVLSQIESHRV